ncbi:Rpn family recombination-promoting nuclease/putative transposase [candidate division KSB1 bacterium]|nr:Rpn family recombination-promoting nuclease/putative transposase [candidate division KSB1 bacterium]
MTAIHDSGYKKLFSNKVIFRQLLETFVNEDWIKELDFDTCETVDKTFISYHYVETESDIIYKIKWLGKEAYIFILIEFQSRVERFMALRILNYLTSFYMDYLASNHGVKMLPAIFPIVLYNGEGKWTAPVRLAELIEDHHRLGRFAIDFEYFKIAENEFSRDELLQIRNIVSTLFLAEANYDIDVLKEEFLTLFDKESDKQAVSLFLNWLLQLSEHGRIEKIDYKSLERIYKNKEEVKEMLISALEKQRQETYKKGLIDGMEQGIEKGIEKGIAKGLKQGIEKEKIAVARKMLFQGLEIPFIVQMTGLSEEEVSKLKVDLHRKN